MGFLIFAYRKLALKRKISDLQFREMSISMNKQLVAEKQSDAASIFQSYNERLQSKYGQGMNELMTDPNTHKFIPDAQFSPRAQEMQEEYYGIKQQAVFAETNYLKQLKSKETAMDQEMASIESQLKLLNAELQSVEKQEDEEAKQSAPKFGQGG